MPPVLTKTNSVALPAKARGRGAINEIIPGKLYQRGQILTWQRDKKYEMFREYGIQTVVNFWPKMDADLAEGPAVNYLQISAVRSEMMLDSRMLTSAQCVATLCLTAPALVLCEAGKTRSVYFCILVVSLLLKKTLTEARDYVLQRVPATSLKPFMLDDLAKH